MAYETMWCEKTELGLHMTEDFREFTQVLIEKRFPNFKGQ
jgi:hypothetical protein